jgi:predicted aspartyl protease
VVRIRYDIFLVALGVMLCGHLNGEPVRAERLSKILEAQNYKTIPLRRTSENHLYQIGRMNGQRGSCLVDTGWSYTTSQLEGVSKSETSGMLTLAGANFTEVPVRLEPIQFNGQRASFDVVLGLDFLRHHFALLDCGEGRLYTRESAPAQKGQDDLESSLRRAGYNEIQLKLKSPPALTLVAKVNGELVEFLMDSGAVWSCVDRRQMARLKLKEMPSLARITGAGKTGNRSVAVTVVKSFEVGGIKLKDATLALFDLADWGFAAPEKTLGEVQGIFGGELLHATSAVIDCHGLKLWIRAPTKK